MATSAFSIPSLFPENVHDPYQVPQRYVDPSIPDGPRRNFSGMVTALDEAVLNVTLALKETGLWNNSILFVHTDNGGELPYADGSGGGAGNNAPLRGGKFSLFEGGIRGRAWVAGPLVPHSRRGATWDGLMHVSDLLPTICEAVGVTIPAHTGPFPLDGVAQWANIMNNTASARTTILHQPLNEYWNGTCAPSDITDKFQPSCGGGILDWPYKLLIGFPGDGRHVPSPGASGVVASQHREQMNRSTACVSKLLVLARMTSGITHARLMCVRVCICMCLCVVLYVGARICACTCV